MNKNLEKATEEQNKVLFILFYFSFSFQITIYFLWFLDCHSYHRHHYSHLDTKAKSQALRRVCFKMQKVHPRYPISSPSWLHRRRGSSRDQKSYRRLLRRKRIAGRVYTRKNHQEIIWWHDVLHLRRERQHGKTNQAEKRAKTQANLPLSFLGWRGSVKETSSWQPFQGLLPQGDRKGVREVRRQRHDRQICLLHSILSNVFSRRLIHSWELQACGASSFHFSFNGNHHVEERTHTQLFPLFFFFSCQKQ